MDRALSLEVTAKVFKNSVLAIALAAFLLLQFSGAAQAQQLLRDTEIEDFLEDYAHPIFRAAGIAPKSIDILLIGDQTPNAFAGARVMGIHTGLLTTADTPNQIEGVIAHEAGHIAGGHNARSGEMAAAATRPMLLSVILAAGAIAAGAPEAGIGILGLGQTIGIANALTYSRGQESAADQAAVTYLNTVGHSSEGLIDFFGKLRNRQVVTHLRVNPYLQSHPLAVQRMTALTERAQASSFFNRKEPDEEIVRLKLIQAKIYGFLEEPKIALRRYPLTDQSDPARYARAVAYYRDAQIEKGLDEINALLEKYPENEFYHELKGQMLFEFGRVPESVAPHRRSVELRADSALLHINLGRALLASSVEGSDEEAVDVLKAALRLERDNSFGWFELARAYDALGQESLANLATAESRYFVGDKAQAGQFARRALKGLKTGSPEWRKASDIIIASQPEGRDAPPLPEEVETEPEAPRPAPPAPRPGEVPDPDVN